MKLERCIECDEPTGNAGIDEDSLYTADEFYGPFCEPCWELLPYDKKYGGDE